jgi:hypothetical protein
MTGFRVGDVILNAFLCDECLCDIATQVLYKEEGPRLKKYLQSLE